MKASINHVLTTCKFTKKQECTYLMTEEGLDNWDSFTMLEAKGFADIAIRASKKETEPFTIGVMKLKYFKTLKF